MFNNGVFMKLAEICTTIQLYRNFPTGTSPNLLKFGGHNIGKLSKLNMCLLWRKNMSLDFELIFKVSLYYHLPVQQFVQNRALGIS